MRASRDTTRVLIATLCVVFGAGVSAHRRDELLQAARVGVEPDRLHVEMNLTPGIAVADRVIGEIDGDGDGVLSPAEQQAYAERVLTRIALRVDDSPPLRLSLAGSSFPNVVAMRTGEAPISLRVEADMPPLGFGAHRIFFRNDNATEDAVYLANALVPENDQVAVTGQQRDFDQRELMVEFALRETRTSSRGWVWIGLACALTLAVPLTRRTGIRQRTFLSLQK